MTTVAYMAHEVEWLMDIYNCILFGSTVWILHRVRSKMHVIIPRTATQKTKVTKMSIDKLKLEF